MMKQKSNRIDATTPSRSTSAPDLSTPLPITGAFSVVGIVGAAGSRLALEKFFRTLPTDAGMAFIIVARLARKEQRLLATALQGRTDLPVFVATDGLLLQSDQVYLVPPDVQPMVEQGRLHLQPLAHTPAHRRFDPFLTSLAVTQGASAVALLLSGAGEDGLAGLQAIKEQGGLVLVQEPNDAAHPSLLRRAVALGIADCVDRAGELAQWLVQSRGDLANQPPDLNQDEHFLQTLPALLSHIASQTGHDLSHYKRSTLQRRILRRIRAAGAAALGQYLELLKTNTAETLALLRDCLVSVTSFFRDADAYEMLARDCIPQLFQGKGRSDLVRVWVAGCATGEEAYSVGMQLAEHAAQVNEPPRWQIFATDLDETAITIARRGLYPPTIAKDIPPGRLQRYFTEENGCYRVKPEIRENILFAAHDLLQDPPFSRLDLVCCRNVLIYFTRSAQEKVFATFHYALNPSGYLFLGASESIDAANDLFAILHKQCHLYQRRNITLLPPRRPLGTVLTAPPVALENKVTERLTQRATEKVRTLEEAYAAWSLRVHTPPRLLVNQHYEITHLFGGAERYLQTRDGAVTQNVLQRIHPDLRLELRAALYQAFNQRERTISRLLSLALSQRTEIVQLQVGPVTEPGFPADTVEVVLAPQENPAPLELETTTERKENDFSLVSRLEEELLRTRERLQQIIEEYETAGQELKVSNEELQSINEELKSTTEELETSKEELQSMNEELTTVNGELTRKIEELHRANSDLLNLIASTEVGAIFLNQQLQINRFTPRAADLFNLIEGDIGRPLAHVTHRLRHNDLSALAAQVKATSGHIDETLQRDDDRWFMLRLFPYRTVTGENDGVVITFIDIHDLKRAESEERQRRQQQSLAELSRQALTGSDLTTLLTTATHRVAEVLNMELCHLLERQPDGKTLLLKAGVGWQDSLVGQANLPIDATNQAGYTLQTHAPVIVRDLRTETRFRAAALLTDHQVRSGISVAIPPTDPTTATPTAGSTNAYGVLGVYSREPRTFTTYDVDYLQAVANLLATTIARRRTESALQRYADLLRLSYDAIMVWHPAAGIEFWNHGAETLYGYTAAEALGQMTHHLLQTEHFHPWPEILAELQRTGLWEGEVWHTTKTGRKLIVSTRHQLITNADGDRLILETNRDITERKATEAALRQSEERFVTIFQHSPYPIAILDLATRTYVDVNPTWVRDTGYTHAEAIGRTAAELGLQTEPPLHLIERLRNGEPVRDQEIRVRLRNGETRTTLVSAELIQLTGQPHVFLIFADITARKQAEEEIQRLNRDLKRRVDELQTLLDVAPIGIFVAHDAECRLITGNPAGARMLGVTPASNASKSKPDEESLPFRVLRDGREVLPAELPMQYAAQHDVTVENVEYEIIRSDGTQLNLYEYAIPLHDEEGRVRGCLGIFVDITERKGVEASLRESEERFRSAFEQAAVGMAHVNGDGQYIRVNDRLCQILGYDRDALLQMRFFDLTHPEDRVNGLALSERLLAGEIPSYTIEKRYLHHNGAIIWVNISASAVRNVTGAISYRLSVIEDITARKSTEAALHELTATLEQRVHARTLELERSNRELDQFAYVASHDLKAPLRAIVNLAGWIAEDAGPVLPPPSLEHLHKLRGRTLRMERLLDDLLTYSRIGRQLGFIEPIRIDLLLQDTIDLLAPPPGFTVTVTDTMPVLVAVRAPIALVFRNLINNAIKHHHQPAQGVVRIGAQALGDFIEFTISDNGPGIDPQFHERIFGMFQTLRPRDEVEGSGMGLAIVKKAVEHHGGLIRVESAVGAGTTFRFTWPKEVFKKTE